MHLAPIPKKYQKGFLLHLGAVVGALDSIHPFLKREIPFLICKKCYLVSFSSGKLTSADFKTSTVFNSKSKASLCLKSGSEETAHCTKVACRGIAPLSTSRRISSAGASKILSIRINVSILGSFFPCSIREIYAGVTPSAFAKCFFLFDTDGPFSQKPIDTNQNLPAWGTLLSPCLSDSLL